MSKSPQTAETHILLTWNVQNHPKRDKGLFLWRERSKIPSNGTNPYSFDLKRPKSPQAGLILTVFGPEASEITQNGTKAYSFGVKGPKFPQTGQISLLLT